MKWETLNKFKVQSSKFKVEELVNILLENRGIKTKKEREDFLNPKLEDVTVDNVGIDKKQLVKAIKRIQVAIEKKEQVVVFGDYDVDGITGSAIIWETLHGLGANVMPYIPHRIDEGYGLSITGIKNLELRIKNVKLIITVDNGIVANEAVRFANEQGMDVIITDHHVPPSGGSKKLPDAYAVVHTTKLCGAGVAWLLSQEIRKHFSVIAIPSLPREKQSFKRDRHALRARDDNEDGHLELVALATVADMVPLVDSNRTLVVYGLQALQKTKRLGLQALFEEAGFDKVSIGTYEVGHVIAPRLNASGRMASAMDSLRLLCTKNHSRAKELAALLGQTNRERQIEMIGASEHAIQRIQNSELRIKNLLFVAHESYQQGTIGLVAGKLVERFYRPAIVVSIGEKESKASARSVKGFNMIEFLRLHTEHFVNVGGHPMAAGFTVETTKLTLLQQVLEASAEKAVGGEVLTRKIRIDCELPLEMISHELYDSVQKLAPFGVGNPEPIFVSSHVAVESVRIIGKDGKHLKLNLKSQMSNVKFEAIGFGLGDRKTEIVTGSKIDVVYTINKNNWNGNSKLELKIKDFKA